MALYGKECDLRRSPFRAGGFVLMGYLQRHLCDQTSQKQESSGADRDNERRRLAIEIVSTGSQVTADSWPPVPLGTCSDTIRIPRPSKRRVA